MKLIVWEEFHRITTVTEGHVSDNHGVFVQPKKSDLDFKSTTQITKIRNQLTLCQSKADQEGGN